MAAMGFRSESQLQGDRLMHERSVISLNEAVEMERRLVKYTGPRILKSLEAKIEAVRADMLGQKAALQLEEDRLKRIERAIGHCTLTAPSDGIIVYARSANPWGRTEEQIDEGVTVREGQAIINLPDPNKMCVNVKVSESKIAQIAVGQPCLVRVDAFIDRPLKGKVHEIKPIPQPAGMVSDVNIYMVVVNLDAGGFAELRPGLSAEVAFAVGSRPKVTRVPVEAVRWVDHVPYVARPVTTDTGTQPEWVPIKLGIMDTQFAEVVSGLKPGDRVFPRPSDLALPAKLPRPVAAPAPPRAVATR
jgi:hypothetical protein